jgi:hypothetical protein
MPTAIDFIQPRWEDAEAIRWCWGTSSAHFRTAEESITVLLNKISS